MVQAGEDKVHRAVQFTRYGADGEPLDTDRGVYVVTKLADRWGNQCRSGFSP